MKVYSDSILGCPGTNSADAGKVSACEGCPNQTVCASGLPRSPDPGKDRHVNVNYTLYGLSLRGTTL